MFALAVLGLIGCMASLVAGLAVGVGNMPGWLAWPWLVVVVGGWCGGWLVVVGGWVGGCGGG